MSKISCRFLSSELEKNQVDESGLLTVMSAGNSTHPPEVTGRCRMNHRLFWDSAFPRMLHDSVPIVACDRSSD